MKKYICTVCDWVYDPEVGDPDAGKPKDPNKGEKIFGEEIKFTVKVVDWAPNPNENGTNIPM